MRKSEVTIGATYNVKVSGRVVPITLLRESPYGGWIGRSKKTGREVRIKTAGRLRGLWCESGTLSSKHRRLEAGEEVLISRRGLDVLTDHFGLDRSRTSVRPDPKSSKVYVNLHASSFEAWKVGSP